MQWLKALGMAGFLFFLVKGLAWLALFWLISRGIIRKQSVARIKLKLRKWWRRER